MLLLYLHNRCFNSTKHLKKYCKIAVFKRYYIFSKLILNTLFFSSTYFLPSNTSVPPSVSVLASSLSLDNYTYTLPSPVGTVPSINSNPPRLGANSCRASCRQRGRRGCWYAVNRKPRCWGKQNCFAWIQSARLWKHKMVCGFENRNEGFFTRQ